jgi:hypothetical protein
MARVDMNSWIRDREQSVGIIVVSVVGFSLIVGSALAFWWRAGDVFSMVFSFGMASALTWFLVARCALAGARPEGAGLRVRNPLRTLVIPWSDIVGIRIGAQGLLPRVALIDLVDGPSVPAWGLQGPLPFFRPKSKGRLEAAVARLDQIALAFRSGSN